jgi:cystathionine beta-lyase/cystathionine gamma-synthase
MILGRNTYDPLMKLILQQLQQLLQEKYTLAVDNICFSLLQRPLDLGADVVMHSGNKVLSRTLMLLLVLITSQLD